MATHLEGPVDENRCCCWVRKVALGKEPREAHGYGRQSVSPITQPALLYIALQICRQKAAGPEVGVQGESIRDGSNQGKITWFCLKRHLKRVCAGHCPNKVFKCSRRMWFWLKHRVRERDPYPEPDLVVWIIPPENGG